MADANEVLGAELDKAENRALRAQLKEGQRLLKLAIRQKEQSESSRRKERDLLRSVRNSVYFWLLPRWLRDAISRAVL